MQYAIPATSEEVISLRVKPPDEEVLAVAILGVVRIARNQGRSLEELTAEVLSEDGFLDLVQRHWLSKMVAQAWQSLPQVNVSST
jgi:hypothetical protein